MFLLLDPPVGIIIHDFFSTPPLHIYLIKTFIMNINITELSEVQKMIHKIMKGKITDLGEHVVWKYLCNTLVD